MVAGWAYMPIVHGAYRMWKVNGAAKAQIQFGKENFYVVYFESSRDLEMGDVDVTDILITVAWQVSESLKEMIPEPPAKDRFKAIFDSLKKVLAEIGIPIPGMEGIGIGMGIFKIFGEWLEKAKDSPDLRSRLRQHLEPRTNGILEAVNKELLEPAVNALKEKGINGLVVIVDDLDRVESTIKPSGRTQPEYLFVDRGDQLKRLSCHIVYTIPLGLTFSNDYGRMTDRFGVEPYVLPMVPIRRRDAGENESGMELLCQMVLARAFPDEEGKQRRGHIVKIFDSEETLYRLCRVSGGHVRGLLRLIYRCILKEKYLPISRATLEDVIRERRNQLSRTISDDEWNLLKSVMIDKRFRGDEQYQELLRGMFVFEYRDPEGSWFDVNPILAEAKELS